MATTALQGWHPGELAIQRKLGFVDAVSDSWSRIRDYMPEQHRIFHTSNLPFIPITTLDEDGRPWASIVSGLTGDIGFVESPDPRSLSINTQIWDGDPLLDTVKVWIDERRREAAIPERFLTAGLGIEFSTRRRNKFAGLIRDVRYRSDSEFQIEVKVTEALGNCPKYINIRKLIPYPNTQPKVVYRHQHLSSHERLPEEVVKFILDADNVFIGTIFKPTAAISGKYPPHAGMNARGGLPGFIRVSPSDGRTVVVPDYSGNRLLSSLGNIEASGLAGLTIVSFTTGDILYLTGIAENFVGPPALKIMTRQTSLTSVKVTGFTFVRDALPTRQQSGTLVERSPYSPKIKYLVEEAGSQTDGGGQPKAELQEAVQISSNLAVFKFKVILKSGANDLRIRPGQAIVLDFMDWIGPPPYKHMADSAPRSINDDRVRTWTVSSAHEGQNATWFELTMREMKEGAVTGALFSLLRNNPSKEPGQRVVFDSSVCVDIVGITGDFSMGHNVLDTLWIAGGIGITPFLAMLKALAGRGPTAEGDIMLVLATKEPETVLDLMRPSLENMPLAVRVKIAIFTHDSEFDIKHLGKSGYEISVHRGRVSPGYWKDVPRDKDVFICGPNEFGDAVMDGLRAVGVQLSQIHREGFY